MRTDSRNGAKERTLTTRVGTLEVQVPRHRNVPFKTLVFENYRRSEEHLLPQWQRWLSFEFQRLRSKELWKRSVGSHFQNRVSLRHTLSSVWPSMHFVTVALRTKGTREPSYRVKSTAGSHRTY